MTEPGGFLPCEDVQRAIHEALGAAGLHAEAARHLETCAACAREGENLDRLAKGLRALPIVEPSEAFWENLPGRVLERIHAARRRDSWGLSALAAAAVLLFTIIPAERERWSPRSMREWLTEVSVTDPGLDPLAGVRTREEAARVVQRVAVVQELGPRALQRIVEVADEETLGRPETLAWNLLDTLGPEELERVLARVEKGARQ